MVNCFVRCVLVMYLRLSRRHFPVVCVHCCVVFRCSLSFEYRRRVISYFAEVMLFHSRLSSFVCLSLFAVPLGAQNKHRAMSSFTTSVAASPRPFTLAPTARTHRPPATRVFTQHVVAAAERRMGLGPGDAIDIPPSRAGGCPAPAYRPEGLVKRHPVRRHGPFQVVVRAGRCPLSEAVQHLLHGRARVAGANDEHRGAMTDEFGV